MTTFVSSKGRIVLPVDIRRQDDIKTGQKFKIERLHAGEYRLVREKQFHVKSLVDWLLDCPAKGYFVPIESESTDVL